MFNSNFSGVFKYYNRKKIEQKNRHREKIPKKSKKLALKVDKLI